MYFRSYVLQVPPPVEIFLNLEKYIREIHTRKRKRKQVCTECFPSLKISDFVYVKINRKVPRSGNKEQESYTL